MDRTLEAKCRRDHLLATQKLFRVRARRAHLYNKDWSWDTYDELDIRCKVPRRHRDEPLPWLYQKDKESTAVLRSLARCHCSLCVAVRLARKEEEKHTLSWLVFRVNTGKDTKGRTFGGNSAVVPSRFRPNWVDWEWDACLEDVEWFCCDYCEGTYERQSDIPSPIKEVELTDLIKPCRFHFSQASCSAIDSDCCIGRRTKQKAKANLTRVSSPNWSVISDCEDDWEVLSESAEQVGPSALGSEADFSDWDDWDD
jgi:hypothetical protein